MQCAHVYLLTSFKHIFCHYLKECCMCMRTHCCALQQEGQALQLRLTITAADRALLRDKLAEAEQQLASYQSLLKDYEAEKDELYDTAYSLYGKVQKLTEQNHAAAAEMQQLKGRLSACFSASASSISMGADAAAAAGESVSVWPAGSSPRKATLTTAPVVAAAAPSPAGLSGSPTFARPKSATASYGQSQLQRSAFAAAAGVPLAGLQSSQSANVTPRQIMHSRSNSSGSSSSSSSSGSSSLAAAAAAALRSAQSHSNVMMRSTSGGGRNASGQYSSELNPICITSPFGDARQQQQGGAAPAAGATAARRAGASSVRGSYSGGNASGLNTAATVTNNGSPLATSSSPNDRASAGSPTLLTTALQTGTSRIPMPPCLQQRPKQLGADNMLLKLGMLQHSKLPSAPSSGCSSAAASTGGFAGSFGGAGSTAPYSSPAGTMGGSVSGIPCLSSAHSSSFRQSQSNLRPASLTSCKPPLAGGSPSAQYNSSSLSRGASPAPGAGPVSMSQHSRSSSADLGAAVAAAGSSSPGSLAGSYSTKQRGLSSSDGIAQNNGVDKQQALLSVGSPVLGPINRLKSGQPGLAAVAAAAAKESALSSSSISSIAAVMAPEEAAAATAAEIAQLWAGALPQNVGAGGSRVTDSA
jgi:hypothetical protein